MSLAMPYPARRRATAKNQSSTSPAGVPATLPDGGSTGALPADLSVELPTEQVWHVGLSLPGMFPFREASCACTKAACGLVVPDPSVDCPLHTQNARFLQVHSSADCDFPRTGWRRRRRPHRP
ncbi:hypothetical protein KIH74_26405 [Kineosporia sp. J2-2]|uniref:Uncharacterized protein n=1 Tax=Kineosporia corallincola TaxID=2835133 RepID=A0ABS5TN42_9ACTN|nr:hypothetical protein [Kineosporia corallincola]MBT0772506.1 hypothetical protein [Kineosporia corallincola]